MNAEPNVQPNYDYVVVGSGAGGGPLAANLAKAGYKVLLLEAGGDHEDYDYQVPCFHGLATEDKDLRWEYFVRHYCDEERQRRDSKFVAEHDGVFYPRSGTLGGCTAHNALITVYPHNSDWDHIAQITGDASWRSSKMRDYFERLECCQYDRPSKNPLLRFLFKILSVFGFGPRGARHGFHGWLSVSRPDPSIVIKDTNLLRVILAGVEEAFVEHLGRPLTELERGFDPNDWREEKSSPEGICFAPLATFNGKRNGSREYIRSIQQKYPDRLTVKTHALATKVLFDDQNKAIGVEYLEGEHLYRADPRADQAGGSFGTLRSALTKREVILSGGAFNSPQLLMLSGIGPKEELAKHGIGIRADLPGVGQNLQDRYEVTVVSEMDADFSLLEDATFEPPREGQEPDACFRLWQSGKGVYTTNGVALGIIKRSEKSRPDPDLFIFGLPARFKGYYPGYSNALERHKNIFTWAILKAHTRNTAGRVTLRSSDPRDTPRVDFHYFEEGNDTNGEDLQSLVDAVQFVRRITAHTRDITQQEMIPGNSVQTPEQIKEYIQNEAWGHHASCSNKMGPPDDKMAVVDSNFRVYGTKNLRVVDASIFPRIPGFFIVSAVYMISEKATDVILANAKG